MRRVLVVLAVVAAPLLFVVAAFGAQPASGPPATPATSSSFVPSSTALPTPMPSAPASSPSMPPETFHAAFFGPDAPSPEPATPQPTWTLRAAVRPGDGGAAWDPTRLAALRRDLDKLLDEPALNGAHAGLVAVDARDGSGLFERRGDDAFQAASTFKLVVGSAALDKLGPDFRFRTQALLVPRFGADPHVANGATSALLVLRGGGDPFFSTADVDDFARGVAASGLRVGLGSFVVDDSHFGGSPYAPGWTWDDFLQDYAPKISAMTLEENVVHLFVVPGSMAGDFAVMYERPLPAARGFLNRDGEGCVPTLETQVLGYPRTLAAGSEATLEATYDRHGCLRLVGGVAAGASGNSLDVAVPDPPAYAYRVAVDFLHAHGVEVATLTSLGGAEPYDELELDRKERRAANVVWTHDSVPLSAIMPRFWIPSDNLVGENLLEELGVAYGGEPGTREKGAAYEKLWLRSIGTNPSRVEIADGCGMSQYDRINPRALVAILQHDWRGPHRELVLDALPVGGARGSIPGIDGTPAAGRVWAKTGSMMHVRGLAGYVATKDRGTVTFAFNVDDFTGDYDALNALRAKILSRIASE